MSSDPFIVIVFAHRSKNIKFSHYSTSWDLKDEETLSSGRQKSRSTWTHQKPRVQVDDLTDDPVIVSVTGLVREPAKI